MLKMVSVYSLVLTVGNYNSRLECIDDYVLRVSPILGTDVPIGKPDVGTPMQSTIAAAMPKEPSTLGKVELGGVKWSGWGKRG